MKTFAFLLALTALLLAVGKTRACDYGLATPYALGYGVVDPGYGVAAPIFGGDLGGGCGCDGGAALLPAYGYGTTYGFNYGTALVSNGFVGVRAVGVRAGGVAVGVGGFNRGFVGVRAGGVGVAVGGFRGVRVGVGGGFGGVRVGVGGFGGGVVRQRTFVRRGIFGGGVVRQRTVIRGGGFGGGVIRQRTVIRGGFRR